MNVLAQPFRVSFNIDEENNGQDPHPFISRGDGGYDAYLCNRRPIYILDLDGKDWVDPCNGAGARILLLATFLCELFWQRFLAELFL